MNLRFYIDPETRRPHIRNHGVDEDEVEDVIRSPGEDRTGRDAARVAVGQTREGRYLRVVYTRDEEADSVFVIAAYELTGRPLAAYRRRMRRRSR